MHIGLLDVENSNFLISKEEWSEGGDIVTPRIWKGVMNENFRTPRCRPRGPTTTRRWVRGWVPQEFSRYGPRLDPQIVGGFAARGPGTVG